MKVQIKLEDDGKIPVKGEPNAMCFDCYTRKIEQLENGKVVCYLGFSATPPKGYGIRLIPRSNLTKYFWVLNNSIGVGDEDFKNEYRAIFTPILKEEKEIKSTFEQIVTCLGTVKASENSYVSIKHVVEDFPYKEDERVCQMEIYKREDFEFEEVDVLPGNDRGGGIGSTGLK